MSPKYFRSWGAQTSSKRPGQ